MEKKEFYRHYLPHFQQPGQAYFVTWCLKDAIPLKALLTYTQKLEMLKSQMLVLGTVGAVGLAVGPANSDSPITICHGLESKIRESEFARPIEQIEKLKKEYYSVRKKYLKAYDDLLDTQQNPIVNLSKPVNTEILIQSIKFWEGKMLKNFAFTIMSNHVHWVFELLEKDEKGSPIYLQDLLQSVKRFSANRINKLENRRGSLWQKESFDTTIRDEKHLYNAIKYTLNNPVAAGLVTDGKLWPGSFSGSGIGSGDL